MASGNRSANRTRLQVCCYYCRLVITFLFSHVGLCTLVMGYAFLGAAVFQWLESDNARQSRKFLRPVKDRLIERLWNITEGPKMLRDDLWKQQATTLLNDFSKEMITLVQQKGYDGN